MTSIDTVVGTTMKVTCGRDQLADKLQLAGRGVSTRTQSVQILGGIMLRAAFVCIARAAGLSFRYPH